MPPQTPSFGSREYWEKRFTSNSSPFEWLEAPTALDPYITAALKESRDPDPQLLHIGCGTSLLSYHLRAHVSNPEQIHNLDYSEVAVEVGRKREVDIYKTEPELWKTPMEVDERHIAEASEAILRSNEQSRRDNEGGKLDPAQPTSDDLSKRSYMRWSATNLLDHSSFLEACRPSTYSVIVDKSTSDSIACSEDVHVPLPYYITTSRDPKPSSTFTESPEPIHPLHIMAVHLALVTKSKARWISLSYSMDRYPFLPLPPSDPLPGSSAESSAIERLAIGLGGQAGAVASTEEPASEDDISLDDDLDDIPQKVIDSGFPDPGLLWRLVGKYDIEPPPPPAPANGSNTNATIHRPKVMHWIYVLERTDVEVFVKK